MVMNIPVREIQELSEHIWLSDYIINAYVRSMSFRLCQDSAIKYNHNRNPHRHPSEADFYVGGSSKVGT